MYMFDNAAPQASPRLRLLSEVFDPGTTGHLVGRGVDDGWTCLEVGGGAGSVTRWLSERVGQRGRVLVTDIDTRHLEELHLTNVEVRQHDVASDRLPVATFDLAYARLVLEHVSNPDAALGRMAASLKAGGWLVVEDFEVADGDGACCEIELVSKTVGAMRDVLAAAGAAKRLGRLLAKRLRAHGLANVATEGRVFLWRGGTAGASLVRLNLQQLREPILATGQVTPDEFEAALEALEDEGCEVASPILWTAWGQRPSQ